MELAGTDGLSECAFSVTPYHELKHAICLSNKPRACSGFRLSHWLRLFGKYVYNVDTELQNSTKVQPSVNSFKDINR